MSADLDALLEQLAEQTDELRVVRARLAELEAARIDATELETAVAATLRAIAEATGVRMPALPATTPAPSAPVWPAGATPTAASSVALANAPVAKASTLAAPPANEDEEEEDAPPPVEPARTSLFGGQQRRLPPTPPNTRKAPPVLSEGAGDDEPEDDDADDQVDGDDEPTDDEEGDDEAPAKPKATPPRGRGETRPSHRGSDGQRAGSLAARIVALLRKGPMQRGDIAYELRVPAQSMSSTLSRLVDAGTLTKADGHGTPYALARGDR